MSTIVIERKFRIGPLIITPAAKRVIPDADVRTALDRHVSGDWGDLCDADKAENEWALAIGFLIFSVYHDRNDVTFYIITEADRSATTILLVEDY